MSFPRVHQFLRCAAIPIKNISDPNINNGLKRKNPPGLKAMEIIIKIKPIIIVIVNGDMSYPRIIFT